MNMMEFPLNECKTMDRWIEEGRSLSISQNSISFLEKIDGDIVVAIDNLVARYIDALKPSIIEVIIDEEEQDKFKYQPKALSYHLYNTTELWSALLYINNMTSITQFNRKKIKVFNSDILSVLEELLIINEIDITSNRNRIDQ